MALLQILGQRILKGFKIEEEHFLIIEILPSSSAYNSTNLGDISMSTLDSAQNSHPDF